MSAKRQATSVLTHDNWDQEEESEERGTFALASEQELKNRVIKKARRVVAGAATSTSGAPSKGVFGTFTGFSKATAPSDASSSPFSFLSKIPAVSSSSANAANSTATTTMSSFSFGSAVTTSNTVAETKTEQPKLSNDKSEKSLDYYAKLKGLNQAVSDWIKSNVDKNPLCILSPVFKDYEKYIADLEKEKSATIKTNTADSSNKPPTTTMASFKFSQTSSAAPSVSVTTTTPKSTFSFGSPLTSIFATGASSTTASTAPKATNASVFGGVSKPNVEVSKTNGFGDKKDDKAGDTPATSSFSFSAPASTTGNSEKPSGFSFTPGAVPFSFANIKPPAALPDTSTTKNGDEEEYQPPKEEFKQVVEDDAVYSKKCKVFVKKDNNFVDRGVGTLYLKPVEGSEKTQLIVRADTNLGNILVNLILSAAIPAQRMGKNNVMLVCVPTPETKQPAPMLLRVKTGEEADELLETIEKYKK